MSNYYLQTLEGVSRFGETKEPSRADLETYFEVCLEDHSEDKTTGAERIVSAFEDVAKVYGVDAVPVLFWYTRNMGRTGYLAIDIWNERHPDPEEVQENEAGVETMNEEDENYLKFQEKVPTAQNVVLDTQWITPGDDWVKIDEAAETVTYQDEDGGLHYIKKQSSGLGWILAAAAAFFFLT